MSNAKLPKVCFYFWSSRLFLSNGSVLLIIVNFNRYDNDISHAFCMCYSKIEFSKDLYTIIDQTVLDWLQSLKQFFINVSYYILVASLTLMALF